MVVLPMIEVFGRRLFGVGVPGSVLVVQNLTLWVAFLGAILAARRDQLLALSSALLLPERFRPAGPHRGRRAGDRGVRGSPAPASTWWPP
jgi:TRAP-type C4-dicarboxylate transport system permease small subunit